MSPLLYWWRGWSSPCHLGPPLSSAPPTDHHLTSGPSLPLPFPAVFQPVRIFLPVAGFGSD